MWTQGRGGNSRLASPKGLVAQAQNQRVLWAGPCGADSGQADKKDQSQQGLLLGTSLLASGLTLLLDEVDQPIGGRVVRSHWAAAVKLRFNFLSQLLSQLHSARQRRNKDMRRLPALLVKSTSQLTLGRHSLPSPGASNSPPLVKAVDVPDDALNEDLVLIHGCGGSRCGGKHVRVPPAHSDLAQAETFPAYSPIKAPRMNGVSLVNTIELVGRFPSKTFRKHPGMSAS